MNLGAPEVAIIALVIILLFGAAKLPKLARSLGEAQKEFKDGMKDADTPPAEPPPAAEPPDTTDPI